MRKILLTGFDPFGDQTVNPSWEVIKQIERENVITACLPVSFKEAPEKLTELVKENKPDLIFCFGQAGGRRAITPESVAVNLMKSSLPDSQGFTPDGIKIDNIGEDKLFTKIDLDEITEVLKNSGVPASVSFSAGTYVCNALFYRLLSLKVKGTFIHVPYIPEQVKGKTVFALDLQKMKVAINSLVSYYS